MAISVHEVNKRGSQRLALQDENVRRKAAEKAAKAGGRGADKATKKPWWQEELDGAAAAKRTSKADDDISAYRAEACTTCPLPHCWPPLAHCLLSDGYLSALYVPVGRCFMTVLAANVDSPAHVGTGTMFVQYRLRRTVSAIASRRRVRRGVQVGEEPEANFSAGPGQQQARTAFGAAATPSGRPAAAAGKTKPGDSLLSISTHARTQLSRQSNAPVEARLFLRLAPCHGWPSSELRWQYRTLPATIPFAKRKEA